MAAVNHIADASASRPPAYRRLWNWLIEHEPRLYALALTGTLFYIASGLGYGIDRVKCVNWPPVTVGVLSSAAYGVALTMMIAAWLGLSSAKPRSTGRHSGRSAVRDTWMVAVVLHGSVMVIPPFLSDDALAYCAIGSAISLHDQSMYAPLRESLPATDAYALLISQYPQWLAHGSTYGPGFNVIAALVISLAGQNVSLALHLFQLVATGAILLAGQFTARAAATLARHRAVDASSLSCVDDAHLRALRCVLLCPLAVIEASSNAHNDSLLALAVAAFAWLIANGRTNSAFLLVATGITVKLSGVLLLAFFTIRQFILWAASRRALVAGGLLAAIGVAQTFWFAWPLIERSANAVVRLIGSVDESHPFCTRSLECGPRALLHFGFGWPWASWLLGLAFRATGAVLLIVLAARAKTRAQLLSHAAAFLLFYYLFLHAYMQAWYLLSLLPLLPFLDDRWKPAAISFVASSLAQYALDFLLACGNASPVPEVRESVGLMIVLLPPCCVILLGPARRLRNSVLSRRG